MSSQVTQGMFGLAACAARAHDAEPRAAPKTRRLIILETIPLSQRRMAACSLWRPEPSLAGTAPGKLTSAVIPGGISISSVKRPPSICQFDTNRPRGDFQDALTHFTSPAGSGS